VDGEIIGGDGTVLARFAESSGVITLGSYGRITEQHNGTPEAL
jgi:hypothetical protein